MIDIRIEKTTAPKAKPDDATLGFGKHFSDQSESILAFIYLRFSDERAKERWQ